MAYPGPVYPDNYTQKTQVQFGGMNHQKSAGDGEWFQTMNLTSDYYPVMASREPRFPISRLLDNDSKAKGIIGGDSVYAAIGAPDFSGCGVYKTQLVNGKYTTMQVEGITLAYGEKIMAKMGPRLIIFPDKISVKENGPAAPTIEPLERTFSDTTYTVYSGTYMGEPATANCIQVVSTLPMDGLFDVGQAVKIKGVKTRGGYDDVTAVIREIETFAQTQLGVTSYFMHLHFYDNTFYFDGTETDQNIMNEAGLVSQAPGYSHSFSSAADIIKREVPDLDVLFVHENRLWGAKGNTIWASALSDPFTWYNFDTVDTACWTVDVLSEGDFTGGCSFLGYPVFFKDNHIYKIYGSVPSDFSLVQSADIGVAPGSGGSLAIAGERLFYLSRAGVMMYTGALPQLISKPAFGDRFMKNGVGASDGLKYRLTCTDEDGERHHFVYDTQNGCWHEESTIYTHMAFGSGNLYASSDYFIYAIGDRSLPSFTNTDMAEEWTWSARSADYTEYSPRRKWLGAPLEIRAELENSIEPGEQESTEVYGAGFAVYVGFDHDPIGTPILIGAYFTSAAAASRVLGPGADSDTWSLVPEGKRSFICRQIPQRTDHYYILIRGIGRVWIYSIAPLTEQGSSYHGKNGR